MEGAMLGGALLMGGITYAASKKFGLEGLPRYVLTLIGAALGVLIVLNAPATP